MTERVEEIRQKVAHWDQGQSPIFWEPEDFQQAVRDLIIALAQAEQERHRWQNDWCDQCDKPQWVLPNGEHNCKTYAEARAEVERLNVEVLENAARHADCCVDREKLARVRAALNELVELATARVWHVSGGSAIEMNELRKDMHTVIARAALED